MNKFIGGDFDGREMPFEEYVGDVFYSANIGDNYKSSYFRTTVEHEGNSYTFWVFEKLNPEEAIKRINKYFGKNQ